MGLKIAHSKTGVRFNADDINKLLELVTTEAGAKYFEAAAEKVVNESKHPEDFGAVLDDIKKFTRRLSDMETSSDEEWRGIERNFSKNFRFMKSIVKEAAQAIDVDNINLFYAVNDEDSSYVRSYETETGDAPSDNMTDKLDDLVSAWLSQNDMLIKDGIVFESDEGTPKHGKNGKPIPADPNDIRKAAIGLSEFSEKEANVKINAVEQPFPGMEKAVPAQEADTTQQDMSRGAGSSQSG